jgi:hypothetical protein
LPEGRGKDSTGPQYHQEIRVEDAEPLHERVLQSSQERRQRVEDRVREIPDSEHFIDREGQVSAIDAKRDEPARSAGVASSQESAEIHHRRGSAADDGDTADEFR